MDEIHSENDDDLKKEKDKIKRRRSSHGRCLARRSICTIVPEDKEVESTILPVKQVSTLDSHVCTSEKNSLEYETERIEIKLYEERTEKLKTERASWRKLIESRRAKLTEALRDNKDAKKGYALIEEEEISPELRNHIKTITLSQPDYNQYLREIKFVKENALLTKLEVYRVTSMVDSFLNLSKVYSKKSFEVFDKKMFGEKKDPKMILKQLQQG